MMSDGSALNEKERAARDVLKKHLGNRATIAKVKQDGEQIAVHVVSPNEFSWTADTLETAGPEAASASGCVLEVSLSTWWPNK